MAISYLTLPCDTSDEEPYQTVSVTLQERVWQLQLNWNQYTQQWFFSMLTENDVPVVASRAVLPGTNLLSGSSGGPGGVIQYLDPTNEDTRPPPPGLSEIGRRGVLVWAISEDELL